MAGNLYLKLLTRLYLADHSSTQVMHLNNRLRHHCKSRLSQSPMTLGAVFRDRLRFIFYMFKNIAYCRLENVSASAAYVVSPLASADMNRHQAVIESSAEDVRPVQPIRDLIAGLRIRYLMRYLPDLLVSMLALLDTNRYELYHLHHFFRKRNLILGNPVSQLHVFGFYNPSCYLLCSIPHVDFELFVYSGNAPLNYPHKHGSFKDLNFVVSNESQARELQILASRKTVELDNVEILLGKNNNYLELESMATDQIHDIGFFSEGWWLRRDGDGFSIEDPDALRQHLEQPRQQKARLELEIFEHLARLAKQKGYSLSLYLHPCEERAVNRGFSHPYAKLVDNRCCFYGARENGISNLYEARTAVTMLPSASIITDRGAVGLVTFYCSTSMLDAFNIHEDFEKLTSEKLDMAFTSLDELSELIDNPAQRRPGC